MKKLVLILFAAIISTGAFAQFSWGLKAGASSNNYKLAEDVNVTAGQTIESAEEASWGFHGGAFVRVSALGLMVQPELLFSMVENNMRIAETEELKSQKFSKLDLPVMLGIKLGPMRLMAGPAASVMLSSDSEFFEDKEDLYNAATFGYQAGVGIDILKKITIDVRYEGGLNTFGDDVVVGTETVTLDGRSNAIIVSAGIMF